eukprot:9076146-Lingulodinium_polyedra.AAC.2
MSDWPRLAVRPSPRRASSHRRAQPMPSSPSARPAMLNGLRRRCGRFEVLARAVGPSKYDSSSSAAASTRGSS